MEAERLRYAPAMLARLAYSDAAYGLSERLVSEVATYADEYGRGAFITEEAATIVSHACVTRGGGRRRQASRRFVGGGSG